MVSYGLVILPFIRELQQAHPGFTQPWYADDVGAGGTFGGIWRHLHDLMVRGPPWGYLPDPTKSIFIISPRNILRAEAFFRGYGLQIVTIRCYLGVFVGWKLTDRKLPTN